MNVIKDYIKTEGCCLGLKVLSRLTTPDLTLGNWTQASDWIPESQVGGGLRLWANAQGELRGAHNWCSPYVVWAAVEYDTASAVSVAGRCVKVPRYRMVAISSNRKAVVNFIQMYALSMLSGLFVNVESGDVFAGDGGIAIVQGISDAHAGEWGIALAGDRGRAFTGHQGYSEAGDMGSAITEEGGIAIAGADGHSLAGDGGIAIAGDGGKAIAGKYGFAIVGRGGSAVAGPHGWAKAGEGGVLDIEREDRILPQLYRGETLYVGRDGIKPDTFYRLNASGKPIESN